MIDYDSAKKLVSYFTNISDTPARVTVDYEIKHDIGKNEMPEMPEISLITIDYAEKGVSGLVEVLVRLEIDARFEDSVNDENVVCGKRVGFNLSTRATENGDYEEEQTRINLIKELAERIARAMEWGWRYDR